MLTSLSQNVATVYMMIFKSFNSGLLPSYSRICMNDMKIPTNKPTTEFLDLRVTRKMAKAEALKDLSGNGGRLGGRAEVAPLRSLYTKSKIYQARIRISQARCAQQKKSSSCFASHIASGPQNWSTWICALYYQISSSSQSSKTSTSPCREDGGHGSP